MFSGLVVDPEPGKLEGPPPPPPPPPENLDIIAGVHFFLFFMGFGAARGLPPSKFDG